LLLFCPFFFSARTAKQKGVGIGGKNLHFFFYFYKKHSSTPPTGKRRIKMTDTNNTGNSLDQASATLREQTGAAFEHQPATETVPETDAAVRIWPALTPAQKAD
jgi:hypothetical protein